MDQFYEEKLRDIHYLREKQEKAVENFFEKSGNLFILLKKQNYFLKVTFTKKKLPSKAYTLLPSINMELFGKKYDIDILSKMIILSFANYRFKFGKDVSLSFFLKSFIYENQDRFYNSQFMAKVVFFLKPFKKLFLLNFEGTFEEKDFIVIGQNSFLIEKFLLEENIFSLEDEDIKKNLSEYFFSLVSVSEEYDVFLEKIPFDAF